MIEYIISILIVTGTFFLLVSAIGILRMPDLYIRMSATTKASTLGVGFILIATAFYFAEIGIVSRIIIIILFLLITAPIAAHMIGRAAYFDGVPLWKGTVTDQLKNEYGENLKASVGVKESQNKSDF